MVEKVQGDVVGIGKTATPGQLQASQAEQLNSVVQSSVTVKKTSGLKKLFRGFFVEDLKTVKTNIVKDVIVPSLKTGLANAITSGVYMWLFGKNGYSNGPGGLFKPLWSGGAMANTSYYSNITRVQNGQVITNNGPKVSVGNDNNFGKYTSADVYDPDYIRYASWQDAENVYVKMCERISLYNVATVAHLMNLSGIPNYEMVLQNWGWYGFDWHRVIPVGDGTFILKLPQPSPLGKV